MDRLCYVTGYKISSARYGWVRNVHHVYGHIIDVYWTLSRNHAMSMDLNTAYRIHAYLNDRGIAHDCDNDVISYNER